MLRVTTLSARADMERIIKNRLRLRDTPPLGRHDRGSFHRRLDGAPLDLGHQRGKLLLDHRAQTAASRMSGTLKSGSTKPA